MCLFLISALACGTGFGGRFAEFEANEVLFSTLAEFFSVERENFAFFAICTIVFLFSCLGLTDSRRVNTHLRSVRSGLRA